MSARLAPQPWMESAQRVMRVLGAPDVDVRFVGGCVRNSLIGRDVVDVDIGTPEIPARVVERLEKAGIKAVPTGIDHGTVTAISAEGNFEITTLRRDTACDGRHAVVEFSTDWHEDARRRDFTMNAIFMRSDGTLFDDHGGIEDAKAGRVRFVGNPEDRIQEDYLRILRLFRFFAWYGKEPINAATLDACRKHAGGLTRLSAERIQQELIKLLSVENPLPAVTAMFEADVLRHVLPEARDIKRLAALIEIEPRASTFQRHWVRRLAALVPNAAAAAHLKLSNAESGRLAAILAPAPGAADLNRALYHDGADVVADRLLLAGVADDRLAQAAAWQPKTLPVSGADVLALGIAPGSRVGELLRAVEDWWIGAEFKPSRDEALAKLKDLAPKK